MPQDNSIPLQAFQGESPVSNYLTAYTQSKQLQRQGVADQQQAQQFEQQNQEFQWKTDDRKQAEAAREASKEISTLRDGDAAGFSAAMQRLVAKGYMKPEEASRYTVNDLPALRAKDAEWRALQEFNLKQQVGQSGLETDRAQRGLIGAQTDAARAQAEFTRNGRGMAGGRTLTSPMNKEFGTLGDQRAQIQNATASFKPEYASRGIFGFGADLMNAKDRTLGGSDAATWWQGYDRYKNVVRNELFGASLTAGEKAAFEAADITPGMDAATITKNLALQQSIIDGALGRRARSAVAQGFNQDAIMELTGLGGIGGASAPPPPSAGGPKEGDTAVSKSGKPIVFRGGKWNYR